MKKLIKDFIDVRPCAKDKVLELAVEVSFLYVLNQSVRAKYFGLDYSMPLLNVAKRVLKCKVLLC